MTVFSAREAAILTCLGDTVLALAPPPPPVCATAAAEAFVAWLAAASRLNAPPSAPARPPRRPAAPPPAGSVAGATVAAFLATADWIRIGASRFGPDGVRASAGRRRHGLLVQPFSDPRARRGRA